VYIYSILILSSDIFRMFSKSSGWLYFCAHESSVIHKGSFLPYGGSFEKGSFLEGKGRNKTEEVFLLRKNRIFAVLLVCMFIALGAGLALADDRGFAQPESIVTAQELKGLVDAGSVKLVDFSGKTQYLLGHIPGAVFGGSIDDPDSALKWMRPSAEQFEAIMSGYGISNEDTVIVYDDNAGLTAARMWWLLDLYGHDRVRLLDGGINAWKAAGFGTQMSVPDVQPAAYKVAGVNESELGKQDEVKVAMDDPEAVILDVRSEAEYTGAKAKGPSKAGRIPGAVRVEWTEAMDADKIFKSADEIRAIYEAQGVTPDKTVYVYCLGGYRAAVSTFVLSELLGYPNVKNYDGAWTEWCNVGENPIEKD
jgi:thiosulfate/3-mercaptopyruvate sulfurtransferase